jgi:hypothetical protein
MEMMLLHDFQHKKEKGNRKVKKNKKEKKHRRRTSSSHSEVSKLSQYCIS